MTNPGTSSFRKLQALVLTNTRQSRRFDLYHPGAGPDPWREYHLIAEQGVEQILRDRNDLPWNPFAKSHRFYAGLDPVRALRILCFDRRADVALCVFENTAFVLLLLRRLFRFRPPIVVFEVSPRGWRLRDFVLDFVIPRADLVLTLTEAQTLYVQATWPVQRPPVLVGGLVDEAYFVPVPPRAATGRNYVLSVGDDFSRDFPTLVEACAPLGCDLILKTSAKLTIPDEMRSRVQQIRERLPYTALRDLYAGTRVVVVPMVPTKNPGGISTLLEAMAMGRPVVASATDTSREFIADGKTGLLVPPKDPAALRSAIECVLRDDTLAQRLGAAARRRVEQDYAMPLREARLAAAIKQFCASRTTKRRRIL